jgi:hypothetical protein
MRRILGIAFVVGLLLAIASPVRADEQADLKALLDKAIKVHGGEDKLTKLIAGTSKFKGKMSFMGQDLEVAGEFSVQLPDKLRVDIGFEIMGQKFQIIQIHNGDKGWVAVNGMTMDAGKDQLDEGKEGMHAFRAQQLVPLKDKAFKLKSLGESKIGDRTAIGVQVAHEGFRDINLYFDKDKGLLLKAEGRAKDMNGNEVNQETFYDDYKQADGVAYAVKMSIKQDGKAFLDLEITEFKPAEKLADNLFAKP